MNAKTYVDLHTAPVTDGLSVHVGALYGALGYKGIFETWTDVTGNFGVKADEPDEVLLARYVDEDYYGHADVVFRNDATYFWVSGSHCSCMGLEHEWEPEPYTLDLLIGAIERRIPDAAAYSHSWEGGNVRRELVELHAVLTMRRTAHQLCPPPAPPLAPTPETPTLSPDVEATLRKLAGY